MEVIRVHLGADFLPASITVDDAWHHVLRPAAFGTAVREACEAARLQRLWSLATEPGSAEEPALDRVRTDPPAAVPTRDVGAYLAEVIEFVNNARAHEEPAGIAYGVGKAATGKVEITLSTTGLESCAADSDWVMRRTGRELTDALAVALAAAREDLAANGPAGRLYGLRDEGLAMLDERTG